MLDSLLQIGGILIGAGVSVKILVHLLEWYLNGPHEPRFDRVDWERQKVELDREFLEILAGLEELAQERARERAQAVQPQPLPAWAQVLQVGHPVTQASITEAHRRLSRLHHPDVGGAVEVMAAVNDARDQAEAWLAKQK